MKLILTIAWRNIFRHKGKTAVIGFIIFLGALVLTVGSGIISGLNRGLQENIVDSFSGDIVLMSDEQQSESVLASMTGATMEPVVDFTKLEDSLRKRPEIADLLPVAIGYVWVLNEAGQPIDQYLLGVDFDSYLKFFPHAVTIIEGKLPNSGERGALVNSASRERIYDYSGLWPIPINATVNSANLTKEARADGPRLRTEQRLIYLGLSQKNSSLDIPSDVIGVFKFKALNKLLGYYNVIDIESLRECMGYFSAAQTKAPPSVAQSSLLSGSDSLLEQAFDFSVDQAASSSGPSLMGLKGAGTQAITAAEHPWRDGTFNVIFVKLKDGLKASTQAKVLNDYFKEAKIPLKAVPWNKAIGMMGQMAMIMKGALLVFVSFIFIVAIIIIMNTLSLAAMERVTEIGMMRAVGAKRSLVSAMFMAETGLLAIFFGGLGIAAGAGIVKVLSSLGLSTQNEMLQIFYGGDQFRPFLDWTDILVCIIALIFVGVLSVIYPVRLARKITPLEAMSRD